MRILLLLGALALLAPWVPFAVADGPKKAEPESKPGDKRVQVHLDAAKTKYKTDKDGDFKLVRGIDGKRTQLVYVNSNTSKVLDAEVREIWSRATISHKMQDGTSANKLLQQNSRVVLGAWQVAQANDKFVTLFVAKVAADADQKTLLTTIDYVAAITDEMEADLTDGKDDW